MYKYSTGRTTREVYDALYCREEYGLDMRGLNTEHLYLGCRTLLDVGCGRRPFAAQLRNRRLGRDHLEPAVCDISVAALEYQCTIHDVCDVFWANLGEFLLPFSDGQFDAVTCFNILEHVPETNVERAIEELITAADKRLVLTIGQQQSKHAGPGSEQLHLTIKPLDWWHERIRKVAGKAQPIRVEHLYTSVSNGEPILEPVTVLDLD